MIEQWMEIPNYKNYQASNLGRIKRLPSKGSPNGRMLKGTIGSFGYIKIGLSKNGASKTFNLHSLIAQAFLDHKPNGYKNGYVIDHVDNDKSNNKLDNLQFIKPRENILKSSSNRDSDKCVSYNKATSKWGVQFQVDNKKYYLGRFTTKEDAILVYNDYLKNNL
jgi:hypothetical protein